MVFFAQKTLVFGPREGVKYYFVDFIRKGGTPPPFWTKFSPKKVTDLGGTPPSPITDIPPEKFQSSI